MDLRGGRGRCWTLITPDNQYVSRLANLEHARVVKLVSPRFAGARFAQTLVDVPPGTGTSAPCDPSFEDFVYVLAGELAFEAGPVATLAAGGFAYLPPAVGLGFTAAGDRPARMLWIKRRYETCPGRSAPAAVAGHRDDTAFEELPVAGLTRRELLDPSDPAFDFNVSLLRFQPGAALDRVEIHDEEHGLYMTAGEGLYYLDGERLEVYAGDFVYMGPYCPQSFHASGAEPAEYLLYKDAWRDGFQG